MCLGVCGWTGGLLGVGVWVGGRKFVDRWMKIRSLLRSLEIIYESFSVATKSMS